MQKTQCLGPDALEKPILCRPFAKYSPIRARLGQVWRTQYRRQLMSLHSRMTVLGAAFLAAILALGPAGAAAAPLSVNVNMAKILKIAAPAATVIIGNPGVADVTIQDPQTLILTGKSYGETNLIVLDSTGRAVIDTVVEVIQTSASVVTVYLGNSRSTLTCEPVCQPTITIGDDTAFTSNSIASANMVQSAAN
jgi:Flp pilus assembly secretin CpaC